MTMKTYPMFRVHVEAAAALRLIDEVFQSGFINEGVQVGQLTEALKPILGSDNLVLMNSCTSALTVAYFLAGVGPGTNVVTTPMTCIAGNTPIINLGGDIIWADVDPRSGMATAETIASKINDKTKAVSIVDWAGVPADLEPIDRLCRSRGIPLIQDAAHAFGARYAGRPLSDFADFTCYSFQAIKHFTCGDAGALICRDDSKPRTNEGIGAVSRQALTFSKARLASSII
jgi:perosamine synthetase